MSDIETVTLHMPGPKKVYVAIAAITSQLGEIGIPKAREVTEGARFKFRGIDQVYAALNPLLAKHNLCILPRVLSRETIERKSGSGKALFTTYLDVEFDFVSSEDGSTHTVRTVGEAMDTGDKSSNKSMSVAYKYACFLTFCIPIEGVDDDPDATVHDVAETETKKPEPPKLTEADATAEFKRAENLLFASATLAGIEDVWKNKIDWTKIPAQWHDAMKKLRKDAQDALKAKPASLQTPAGAPPVDDDIPF